MFRKSLMMLICMMSVCSASPYTPRLDKGTVLGGFSAGAVVTDSNGRVQASSGCYAIEAFGGKGDGVTNNDVAIANAVTAFGTKDVCISFGTGTFAFASNIVFSLSAQRNLRLIGSGKETTVLYWPSGNSGGITIARAFQNTIHLKDFSIITGVIGGGTALNITDVGSCAGAKSTSTIDSVAFKGITNGSSYWNNLIVANDINLLNIVNSDFFGDASGNNTNGITYQGKSGSCMAVILNLTGDYFGGLHFGFIYGAYAQGVTIAQSNFNQGQVGIYSNTGLANLDQLAVYGSQFNTNLYQIYLQTTPTDLIISNNLFFLPTGLSGVILNYGNGTNQHATISSNTYRMIPGQTGGTGNAIAGGPSASASAGVISGNVFEGLNNGNFFSNTAFWKSIDNVYPSTAVPNNAGAGCTSCSLEGIVPVLSGAGTGATLSTGATDDAGTVTEGSSATGFTLTFGLPSSNPRNCIVMSQNNSISVAYTVTTTTLVATNASNSGSKFTYRCSQ